MADYTALFSKRLAAKRAQKKKEADRRERIRKQYEMAMMLWSELSLTKLEQEAEEELLDSERQGQQESLAGPSRLPDETRSSSPLTAGSSSIMDMAITKAEPKIWPISLLTDTSRSVKATAPCSALRLATSDTPVEILYSRQDQLFNIFQYASDTEDETHHKPYFPKQRVGPGHYHYHFIHKE